MITEFKEYLMPKTVYIPLTDSLYKIANVKVEVDEIVKVGQVLGYKFNGKQKLPVLSSVSGTVKGFEMLEDRYGKTVDHCVIENDNKQETVEIGTYEDYETIPSSELRQLINEYGMEYLNVDGLFTPLKFDDKVEHLVVNAMFMLEPFYTVDYEKVLNVFDLVKGIELLQKASVAETTTLLVDRNMSKEQYTDLMEAVQEKNIKVVALNPFKVNGEDIALIKKLVNDDINYDLIKSGIMYVKSDAAIMLQDAVLEGVLPTTRNVVITGDGVKQNAVIEVRVGTLLSDIVEELGGYNDMEEIVVHIGNFLTGNQVTTDQFAITQTVDAINLSEYEEAVEDVCIKCGDCNDVCPVGILPQNIMDAELRSVNDRIVDLQTDLCVECGLCTFVCPSKINVLEWVRRAKRRVG
jgi:electron transport complex protein RnfC